MSEDLILSAMMKLVHEEPFFANLLMNMTRNYTTDIPTLGVNVTDNVNLWINPYFWKSLTLKEQVDILKHEAYHVINNHFGRFADLEPEVFENKPKNIFERAQDMKNASTLNYAGDYAINEYLPNLPKKISFFDKEGKQVLEPDTYIDQKTNKEVANPNAGKPMEGRLLFVDDLRKTNGKIEKNKNLEYYYDWLKQENQNGGQGKGQGKGKGQPGGQGTTLDDHSIWQQGNQDVEFVTEKVKQTVNKAVEQSGGLAAGNIPSDVKEAIHHLNHKPRDWRSDLNRFVSRATEIMIDSSRKRRNRRYGILYPGIVTYPKLNLSCIVDTSGSMSNEALSQIACELDRISKNNVEITVIEADCQIQRVWKFDAKKLKEFQGRGGTAYQPAITYAVEELDTDGIIYFGDMDAADRPKKPGNTPVLWAIVNSDQRPPADWGSVTKVTINKKK